MRHVCFALAVYQWCVWVRRMSAQGVYECTVSGRGMRAPGVHQYACSRCASVHRAAAHSASSLASMHVHTDTHAHTQVNGQRERGGGSKHGQHGQHGGQGEAAERTRVWSPLAVARGVVDDLFAAAWRQIAARRTAAGPSSLVSSRCAHARDCETQPVPSAVWPAPRDPRFAMCMPLPVCACVRGGIVVQVRRYAASASSSSSSSSSSSRRRRRRRRRRRVRALRSLADKRGSPRRARAVMRRRARAVMPVSLAAPAGLCCCRPRAAC